MKPKGFSCIESNIYPNFFRTLLVSFTQHPRAFHGRAAHNSIFFLFPAVQRLSQCERIKLLIFPVEPSRHQGRQGNIKNSLPNFASRDPYKKRILSATGTLPAEPYCQRTCSRGLKSRSGVCSVQALAPQSTGSLSRRPLSWRQGHPTPTDPFRSINFDNVF